MNPARTPAHTGEGVTVGMHDGSRLAHCADIEVPPELAAVMPSIVGDAAPSAYAPRLRDGSLFTWLAETAGAARCCRPVRLVGSSRLINPLTGAVVDTFTSADRVDGCLYLPCGSRLASVCPGCALVYRYDTYHLFAAGLRGGKGVPVSVAAHPALFATFTAPSFGAVHISHGVNSAKRCRPRREDPYCPHGLPESCGRRHTPGDPLVSTPLCLDCYDHHAQVVWNRYVPLLWTRTMDRLARQVARLAHSAGVPLKLRYAKVAEFQARGAVHLHALFRLDGHDPADPERWVAPPAGITTTVLADLVRLAAARTAIQTEAHPDHEAGWVCRWGEQLDVRTVRETSTTVDGTGQELTERHVAGYLAKYATKSTDSLGSAIPPLTKATVDTYAEDSTHRGRLVAAAWRLGHHDHGESWNRLRTKAHMLGFTGHFATKSRRYSTTMAALRAARRPAPTPGLRVITPENYDKELAASTGAHPDDRPEHDEAAEDTETVLLLERHWTYTGTGWLTSADEQLALAAAAHARAYRD